MRKVTVHLLLATLLVGTTGIVGHAQDNKKDDPVKKGEKQGEKDVADYHRSVADQNAPKSKDKPKPEKPKNTKPEKSSNDKSKPN